MVKRLFDLTITIPLLIISLPFILFLSFIVIKKIGRPIFFINERPGKNGIPFKFIKFRTMTNECDENGNFLPDEERLTKFGKFMRSTSIDELPSLFNVLKGDMSLVGPRPLLVEYLNLYTTDQFRRHEILPGITGLAQISGRNSLSWEEKFKLDIEYVDTRTLILDLKILFLTFHKVLVRDGISYNEHATMPKFKGSINKNNKKNTNL